MFEDEHYIEFKFLSVEVVLRGKPALLLAYPLGALLIAVTVWLLYHPLSKLSIPFLGLEALYR